MGSAGPVDVHVDFAELGRVQTELQRLVALVEDLDELCAIRPDGEQMGSGVAAQAVAAFGDMWRTARHTMSENLAGCRTYVEMALQGYGSTERTLGAAVGEAATIDQVTRLQPPSAAGGGGGDGAW
jgi:hypothetical protein